MSTAHSTVSSAPSCSKLMEVVCRGCLVNIDDILVTVLIILEEVGVTLKRKIVLLSCLLLN